MPPVEKIPVNKKKLVELLELVAFPKGDLDIKRAQKRAATMLKVVNK